MIHAALDLAGRGWDIFPVRPRDKRPLTAHGFQDATTDPATIEAWWTAHPTANIGVATGKRSGIFVVDVDPRNGGHETIKRLILTNGRPEPTLVARTGGHELGRHLYFVHPGGPVSSATNILPGIDIKSDGGYVLAPPSVHPNGQPYAWHEQSTEQPTQAPGWLWDALAKRRKQECKRANYQARNDPAHEQLVDRLKAMPDGERNRRIFELSLRLAKGDGLQQPDVLSLVSQANASKCAPPLPDSEVERIVDGVFRNYV